MNWDILASQNPWWADPKEIENDEKVKEALGKKQKYIPQFVKGNYLILGPRQTGKTTYLKLCMKQLIDGGVPAKECLYFVCNLVMNPQDIIDIVNLFKQSGGKYVFLDEIGFVPSWERAVKQLLEVKELSEGLNFYFTGSSTLELQKERFPGRSIKIREFLPLDFREFCMLFGSEDLKKDLIEKKELKSISIGVPKLVHHLDETNKLFCLYVHCGGFLRSAYELVEGGKVQEDTLQVYWNWIAGDITRLGLSERTLSAVLKGVVRRYSTSFSLSSIAKEVEIPSHMTVRDYLELLESLFVLRSYWKGYEKAPTFRRERKVYFIDPFLYHLASFKTSGAKEEAPEDTPKIIEGVVGEALRRAGYDAKFLRGKRELDFFAGSAGIEVKWQQNVLKNDFPDFPAKKKVLLSKNQLDIGDGVDIIPTSLFLLLV